MGLLVGHPKMGREKKESQGVSQLCCFVRLASLSKVFLCVWPRRPASFFAFCICPRLLEGKERTFSLITEGCFLASERRFLSLSSERDVNQEATEVSRKIARRLGPALAANTEETFFFFFKHFIVSS